MQYDVRHTRQNSGPCLHSAALIDMALVNSKTNKKKVTYQGDPISRLTGKMVAYNIYILWPSSSAKYADIFHFSRNCYYY